MSLKHCSMIRKGDLVHSLCVCVCVAYCTHSFASRARPVARAACCDTGHSLREHDIRVVPLKIREARVPLDAFNNVGDV